MNELKTISKAVLVMTALIFTNLSLICQSQATQKFICDGAVFELTVESTKLYSDPFNDVDVDMVFQHNGKSWRVPMFWNGEHQWSVRFRGPEPGEYRFHLESSDSDNPSLNGHSGRVILKSYAGSNEVLRHGMLQVSANGRYFEHLDGTPFFWLGDTWWEGLSDRLSWDGFQTLLADRKAKGFTVVQTVAGLVPFEETGPSDPGFRNEGGSVWEGNFERINPKYFDYADRRIFKLIEAGIVPAIVGGWSGLLKQMGEQKMKQHWRYIVARWAAFPAFWIIALEVIDPPKEFDYRFAGHDRDFLTPGWTDVARYVHEIDPYHHPVTIHEAPSPYDFPAQDESVTDFDMFQSGHFEWASLALAVAQLNTHYARRLVKPIVEGEIGYERLGGTQFENFQRDAFWLSMLNGAAGHTYGADGVYESYTADKPLHRIRYSFVSWEEGMSFPGSYQVGMQAKLLRQFEWWRFVPHPDWVTPRGTTLLDPQEKINDFDLGKLDFSKIDTDPDAFNDSLESGEFPGGEWKTHGGTIRRPFSAGISAKSRIVYIPYFGLVPRSPPTVLGLETGVRYYAYFWQPVEGVQLDLGSVTVNDPGRTLFSTNVKSRNVGSALMDSDQEIQLSDNKMKTCIGKTRQIPNVQVEDVIVVSTVRSGSAFGVATRYQNSDNFVIAMYSPSSSSLFIEEKVNGSFGPSLGKINISALGTNLKLSIETQGHNAIASLTDESRQYTTPIVDITIHDPGHVRVVSCGSDPREEFTSVEVRASPVARREEDLPTQVYDARGNPRGNLETMDWAKSRAENHVLLNAYRPDRLPMPGDWLLLLNTKPLRFPLN